MIHTPMGGQFHSSAPLPRMGGGITAGMLQDTIKMPGMSNSFIMAMAAHIALFVWNPAILTGGHINTPPVLMEVKFQDKLPEPPPPKKVEKKEVAKKSGIALAKHAPIQIKPVKKIPPKVIAAPPKPKSRPSMVKMPKFIPRASDDMITSASQPQKLATATALKPPTAFAEAPKLKGKSRGIRATDVKFELTERSGGISGAGVRSVAIPIGDERSNVAVVASAELHDAPKGMKRISSYQAPLGDGVGELAGKNRKGYAGSIQVGEPSEEDVIAAVNGHGNAAGKGVEIGGPVGDRKILRRHLPEYPAWAEEKGISAMVKIFFTVRPDGSIRSSCRIVRSSGYAELDTLAKEALMAWKFSPTSASSSTEEAWGVITFRFTLA